MANGSCRMDSTTSSSPRGVDGERFGGRRALRKDSPGCRLRAVALTAAQREWLRGIRDQLTRERLTIPEADTPRCRGEIQRRGEALKLM
jgi:hypothetical protein